jgi:hypothetical protein
LIALGEGAGLARRTPHAAARRWRKTSPSYVDEVDHPDLHRRPGDADRADEEVHFVLLHGEDVLDLGSDFRFQRVGLPRRLWHGAARRFLAMDAADEAVLCEEVLVGFRAIGRIGPYHARGVGLVEQAFAQARAFVGRGVARVPAPDQAERAIDRNVEGNCFFAGEHTSDDLGYLN